MEVGTVCIVACSGREGERGGDSTEEIRHMDIFILLWRIVTTKIPLKMSPCVCECVKAVTGCLPRSLNLAALVFFAEWQQDVARSMATPAGPIRRERSHIAVCSAVAQTPSRSLCWSLQRVCSENKGDSGCLVETSQSIWGLNFIFWVSSQTYPPCNWCSGFKLEWHHDSDWWGQPCWLVDPLTGVWRGVLSSSRGTRLQRAVCRNGSNYYHLERKETSYWSL